jgi:D-lyxose ketol-isomerase
VKRSEIDQGIRQALEFFQDMHFSLPPWATWSPEQWKASAAEATEVFQNQLGWDLTDFGSGAFHQRGLLLFTIRNGNPGLDSKPYAEKIMVVEEGQETPMHFHRGKMEDIINRGGGNLMMELWQSDLRGGLSNQAFEVSLDGIRRRCKAGDTVRLSPGESICLPQGLYHRFYGEPGQGKVLVGEVSMVNDDQGDNYFLEHVGRFPEIEEDAEAHFWLVGDYPRL